MSRMININVAIESLKKQRMEICFTPIGRRAPNYISLLRHIKEQIAKLTLERCTLIKKDLKNN